MEYTSHRTYIPEGNEKNSPNKEFCGPLLPICLTKPVDTRQMTRFKNAPVALYRRKQTVIEERHYKDEYSVSSTWKN